MMGNMENLIKALCPNGIVYRNIKEIAEVGTGNSNGNEAVEDGAYPFFVRSQTVKSKDDYEYDEAAIIIPGEGGIGDIFHYVSGKYALHQRVYRIHFLTDEINTKFAYYYMAAQFKDFIMKRAVSATVTSIRKPMIESFRLPIPPLEVQCETVRILDFFTVFTEELKDNLTAEFAARKKQYKFYRDRLLDFKEGGVQRIPMRNLFDFRNGLSKGKEFFGKGTPFIRYTDVYNHRFLHKEDITERVTCTEKEIENLSVKRGDILFTRTSETAEEVGYSSVMLDNIGECVFNGFTIRATPKTDLLMPEYCAYCFSTNDFRNYVATHCAFTTRASLTGTAIGEYQLAVPSMEVQKRLVYVLEQFETICNDLNIGLLAEIEARQKQYEFYREKLLNFKELSE